MQQLLAHFFIVIIKGVFTSADTYSRSRFVAFWRRQKCMENKMAQTVQPQKAHRQLKARKPSADNNDGERVKIKNGAKRLRIYLDRIA
jgi:hypothetical protein